MQQYNIHGRTYTATAFADWANVSQVTMNRYLRGKTLPDGPNILAMGQVMPKVMDIMEYPENPILRKLLQVFYSFPEDKQDKILKQIEQLD